MYKYIILSLIVFAIFSLTPSVYSKEEMLGDKAKITLPDGYTLVDEGRFSSVDYSITGSNGVAFGNIQIDDKVITSSPYLFETNTDTVLREAYLEYSSFEKGCNDGYLSTTANYCYVIYKAQPSFGDPELYILRVWYEINENEEIEFNIGALSPEVLEANEPIAKQIIASTTPLTP